MIWYVYVFVLCIHWRVLEKWIKGHFMCLIHEWKYVIRISLSWKFIHIIPCVSFQINESGGDMVKMRNKEYTSILLMGIEKYYSVPCLLCTGLKLLCCHVYFICLESLHKILLINFYWHIIALQYFLSFYCFARVSQVAHRFIKVHLPMRVMWVLSLN